MNKVYAVTRGDYSDYHVESIFSTREVAEKYCALNWDRHGDYPNIEEYDVEDGSNLDCDRVYYGLFFHYIKPAIKPFYEIHLGITPFKTDICRNRVCYFTKYIGISGYIPIKDNNINEETALKIINDHVAKFKAEEAGL